MDSVVVCAAKGCGTRLMNPCGHSLCHTHSLCSVEKEGVTFWSRQNCQVCQNLWAQATGFDLAAQHQAIGALKSWIIGFLKNRPGPYLDSEISRLVLFPRVSRSAVVGYIPPKSEPRSVEGSVAGVFLADSPISAEEEEGLLNPPDHVVDPSAALVPRDLETSSSSGGAPGLPVVHSSPQGEMEVELTPALAQPASVQSPTDKSASSGLLKVLGISREDFADEIQGLVRSLVRDSLRSDLSGHGSVSSLATDAPMDQSLASRPSTSRTRSDLFPVEDCPPTSSHNPWRSAEHAFFSDDGLFHPEVKSTHYTENIEFFPSIARFPLCYWRFHPDAIADVKVPQETVILPAGQASRVLAGIARAADFKRLGTGALGGTEFIFETEEHAKLLFVVKTTKAVLKSFKDNDPKVFSNLKEFKLFGVFAPSLFKSLPAGNNLSEVFKAGHLKTDSPSMLLKDRFDNIPQNLINEEFDSRQRLARSLTLQIVLDTKTEAHPANAEWAMLAKLHAATYGEHLKAFIDAKRKCRSHVLAKVGVKHEAKMLIESSAFCSNLFPADKVKEVLDMARRDNMTLASRWQMPIAQGVSASSSSSGSKKRKYTGKKFSQSKRRPEASDTQSPASYPKHEGKGKTFFHRRKGDGKGKPGQSKKGKPFFGKGCKGGSSQ